MRIFGFLICAILQYSASAPISENSTANSYENSELYRVEDNSFSEHISLFPDDREEYVLLVSEGGHVIIINAKTYQEMTAYLEPKLEKNTFAIVKEKFYCIDKMKGSISSSYLTNVITRPNNDIKLEHTASFPKELAKDRSVAAVTEDLFYFTTISGKLYKYDTKLEQVKFCTDFSTSLYTSLAVESSILYVLGKENDSFTYQDNKSPWNTTDIKDQNNPALFVYKKKVCSVGGGSADKDSYPVCCYNVQKSKWKKFNSSIEARQYPGIATTRSGTFIFGGIRVDGNVTTGIKTVEVFEEKTGVWSYIPSPPSMLPMVYSAMSFDFGKTCEKATYKC